MSILNEYYFEMNGMTITMKLFFIVFQSSNMLTKGTVSLLLRNIRMIMKCLWSRES